MERKCTNISSLFVCCGFVILLLILIGYSATKTDINRFTRGFDDCGNICGVNNNKDLKIANCTAQDMTLKPKLEVNSERYYFNQTILRYKCVQKCDSGFTEVFNRCYKTGSDTDISSFFTKMSQDFIITWPQIILTCVIAAIFSYILLILFRYAIEYIIWIIYVGFVLAIAAGAVFFWVWFIMKKQTEFLIPAVILSLMVAVVIFVLVWFRKRIKLVAQLFKEASKALIDITSILFEPILTFFAIMLAIVAFVSFLVLIQTSGNPTDTKNLDGSTQVTFQKDIAMEIARIINVIAFLWFTQFIFGCQHFVISGTISKWYFIREKNKLDSPVWTTFNHLIRFHLGSVCLGSIIITLVKILRMIVDGLRNQAREDGNFIGQFIACCCSYIMELIEQFLKYLIRNAYIIVAKDGTPLIESGRKAFKLIFDNLIDVIALNQFGDIVLVMGRLFVVVLSSFIAYYMMNKPDVNYVWVPVLLSGIFALLIAHCFITVFEMTVDTIFICFCEDITENDGASRPYYMSPELMDVMRKLKDEAGGDFNFGTPQQVSQPLPYPVVTQQPSFYSNPQQNFYPYQTTNQQRPY